jgi:hypothetical protein
MQFKGLLAEKERLLEENRNKQEFGESEMERIKSLEFKMNQIY